MNKVIGLLLITVAAFSSFRLVAQEERQGVEQALNAYIEGTSYTKPAMIAQAFHKEANLFLQKENQEYWKVPSKEYISWFAKRPEGTFTGRLGRIISVDIEGNIATAKAEILFPKQNIHYIDLFLLKKLRGQWKIISKSAVKYDSNKHGDRVLFIVSNAHFHGDTKLPAGVSFSEIVKAYETFEQAGYTVDFVSPEGGAIPLSYIDTSEPIHKKYLYNADFMEAIKHTYTPAQINPDLYKAVHYVGGSNAMYGVAENSEIQAISMHVYEKNNGIVSAVCHGTAGIVNLKTSDGSYLVKGKRISGYPESFENQSKAYFKEFPLLIQQSIEKHGGTFVHSERNTPHLEIDGRIITGQNHLSSPLVAEAIVKALSAG